MGEALSISKWLSFVTVDCYKCGVTFAVSTDLQKNWLRDQTQFFCPNGHPQSYAESTAQRLQRELDAAKRDVEWQKQRAASLDKQLTAQRGVVTKLKKRVSAGVCPCCQRTVSQLARHMQSKHPEFVKQA